MIGCINWNLKSNLVAKAYLGEDIAAGLIEKNNGFSLDRDSNGNPNPLFNIIGNILKGDVNSDKLSTILTAFALANNIDLDTLKENIYTYKDDINFFIKKINSNLLPISDDTIKTLERGFIRDSAIKDGTFMLAPNGKPSKLDERQWVEVRTKAFKNWFGDWENDPENASQVTENGEPKVLWHGTDLTFDTFEFDLNNKRGRHLVHPATSIWFTDTQEKAKKYRKGLITIPVFLNLRNPGYSDVAEFDDIRTAQNNEISILNNPEFDGGIFIRFDKEGDNHGLIPTKLWAAKSPSQIKSATDNSGNYSENSNVYLSRRDSKFREGYQSIQDVFGEKEEITISEAFKSLSKNYRITPLLDEIKTFLINKKVKIQLQDKVYDSKGNEVDGLYISSSNLIIVSKNSTKPIGQVVIHEIIHSQLVAALINNPEIDANLTQIRQHAIKILGDKASNYYGLTDNQEFLAEIFTEGRLVKALAHIDGINANKPTGIMNRILDWFKKVLNFLSGNKATLLDNTLYEIENLLNHLDNKRYTQEHTRYVELLVQEVINDLSSGHHGYDECQRRLYELSKQFPDYINLDYSFIRPFKYDGWTSYKITNVYRNKHLICNTATANSRYLKKRLQGELAYNASFNIKCNVPLNRISGEYQYGFTQIARPEIIEEFGENISSIEMIRDGYKTRTTRSATEAKKYNLQVGDIFLLYGMNADGVTIRVLTRVTAIYGLDDPRFLGNWFKEGWFDEGIEDIKRLKPGALAIEFEVIDDSDNDINIFARTEENADLSNFANRPFVYKVPGDFMPMRFDSVEQAFLYTKAVLTHNWDIRHKIKRTTNNSELRKLGREIEGLDIQKWDSIKYDLMKDLIKESFLQNPKVLLRLLDTGTATLTHTLEKGEWGTLFPKLLMEVREEIRKTNPHFFTFDDGTTIITPFDLNEGQAKAVNEMVKFLNNRDSEMTLMGYAGTGKTSVMLMLAEYAKQKRISLKFSATTHAAAAVLNSKVKDQGFEAKTIHSLLGIRVRTLVGDEVIDVRKKEKDVSAKAKLLSRGSIIILDESSMLSLEDYSILMSSVKLNGFKIIFVGDPALLSPVGDVLISPVFRNTSGLKITLTEVMRTGDNAILKEATDCRTKNQISYSSSFNDRGEGVAYIKSSNPQLLPLVQSLSEGLKEDINYFRVLAYNNKVVDYYNDVIRKSLGYTGSLPLIGEILVGFLTILLDDTPLITNSQYYRVLNVEDKVIKNINVNGKNLLFKINTILLLVVNSEEDKIISIDYIDSTDPENAKLLIEAGNILIAMNLQIGRVAEECQINAAKGIRRAWDPYWSIKADYDRIIELIITNIDISIGKNTPIQKSISFGYAVTVHKSLGSTFRHVLVIDDNIEKGTLYDRSTNQFRGLTPEEKQLLRYVAITRASKTVTLVSEQSKKEDVPLAHFDLELDIKDANTNDSKSVDISQKSELQKYDEAQLDTIVLDPINIETPVSTSTPLTNTAEPNYNTTDLTEYNGYLPAVEYKAKAEMNGKLAFIDKHGIITITRNEDLNIKEVLDYIYGRTSVSLVSILKQRVFRLLHLLGITEENLIELFNDNKELISKFLYYYELSHYINEDIKYYWKNSKDLLTIDKLAIEARAIVDAYNALIKDTGSNLPLIKVTSITPELFSNNKEIKSTDVVFTQEEYTTGKLASDYAKRTRTNIEQSDITIAFAINWNTGGEKSTLNTANELNKPIILITLGLNLPKPEEVARKIILSIKRTGNTNPRINIAGNGIYTFSKNNIELSLLDSYLAEIISLVKQEINIKEIRSGGLSGADEAGIKAAVFNDIPAVCHAPNGFIYRNLNEIDIKGESSFKSRFNDYIIKYLHKDVSTTFGNYSETFSPAIESFDYDEWYNGIQNEILKIKLDILVYSILHSVNYENYTTLQKKELIRDIMYNISIGNSDAKNMLRKALLLALVFKYELAAEKYKPKSHFNKGEDGHYNIEEIFNGLDITQRLDLSKLNLVKDKFVKIDKLTIDRSEIIAPRLYRNSYMLGTKNVNEIDQLYFLDKCQLADKNADYNLIDGVLPVDYLIKRLDNTLYGIAFIDPILESIPQIAESEKNAYEVELQKRFGELQDNELLNYKYGYIRDEFGRKLIKIELNDNILVYRKGNTYTFCIKGNPSSKIVEDIIKNDDFILITLPVLSNISKMTNSLLNYLLIGIKYTYLPSFKNDLKVIKENNTINPLYLSTLFTLNYDKYKADFAELLWQSYLQTMYLIAIRIPTQSMQSFMEMKSVAFNSDNRNNVFVTRWQLWLQGSDLDIDKAYVLGYDVDKSGKLALWSPLFNFRSEQLKEASLQLPFPSGKLLIITNEGDTKANRLLSNFSDINDIINYYNIDSLDKYAEEIAILKLEKDLLDIINNNDGNLEISSRYLNAWDSIIEDLEDHLTYEVTEGGIHNFLVQAMHNALTDPRVVVQSHLAIDESTRRIKSAIDKARPYKKYNVDNKMSLAEMTKNAAVGKDVVGVMANGEKLYFCLLLYENNFYDNPNLTLEDIEKSKHWFCIIINLTNKKSGMNLTSCHTAMSDVLGGKFLAKKLNELAEKYIPKEYWTEGLRTAISNEDASSLISAWISLAADNAKEMALNVINAGLELACIHIYLTIMGYSPELIVDYTTSPVFNLLSLILDKSVINGQDGTINSEVWEILERGAGKDYSLSEVSQLKIIYQYALECTRLAQLLGINQGLKADEDTLSNVRSKMSSMFKLLLFIFNLALKNYNKSNDENNNNNELDPYLYLTKEGLLKEDNLLLQTVAAIILRHHGINEADLDLLNKYVEKLKNINKYLMNYGISLADFELDVNRYFNDENYRNAIVEIYDVFKSTFNVFDVLNLSHYFKMLLAAEYKISSIILVDARERFAIEQAPKVYELGIKEVVTKDETDESYKLTIPGYYVNSSIRGLLRGNVFDEIVNTKFLESLDIDIEARINKYFNIKGLKSEEDILSFIEFVNSVILHLKKTNPTNKFLKYVSYRNINKGKESSAFYIVNMRDKFRNILGSDGDQLLGLLIQRDFNKLLNLSLDDTLEVKVDKVNSRQLTFGDLLYIYDTILSFYPYSNRFSDLFGKYAFVLDSLLMKKLNIEKNLDSNNDQLYDFSENIEGTIVRDVISENAENNEQLISVSKTVEGSKLIKALLKSKLLGKENPLIRYRTDLGGLIPSDVNRFTFLSLKEKTILPELIKLLAGIVTFEYLPLKNLYKITFKGNDQIIYIQYNSKSFKFFSDTNNDKRSTLVAFIESLLTSKLLPQVIAVVKDIRDTIINPKAKDYPLLSSLDTFSILKKKLEKLGVELILEENENSDQVARILEGKIFVNVKSKKWLFGAMHELAHIVLAVMRVTNPLAFSKLMWECSKCPLFLEELEKIKRIPEYKNLMRLDLLEETFVSLLERICDNRQRNINPILENNIILTDGEFKGYSIVDIIEGNIRGAEELALMPYITQSFGKTKIPNALTFFRSNIGTIAAVLGDDMLENIPKTDDVGFIDKVLIATKLKALLRRWISENILKEKCD